MCIRDRAVCFVGLENLIDTEELALMEGAGAEVAGIMAITKVAALTYLMFNLYTPPCFAAIGAMNSEMKSAKWIWGGIGLQLGVGYSVGYLVYTIGTLITAPATLNVPAALAGLAAVPVSYTHLDVYKRQVYLRFGRLAVPVFNDPENYHFEIGKGITLRDGKDVTIVATGLMVNEAVVAAEQLAAEGIDARVINIHTIKPLDEELIVKAAKETGKIVTVEEHSVIGGLGSAVADVCAEKCPCLVKKIGVNDEFGQSGPAVDLLKLYGLSSENIVKTVKEVVGK